MKVDLNALCSKNFVIKKENSAGTSVGSTKLSVQRKKEYMVASESDYSGFNDIIAGLLQKSHSDFENLKYDGMSDNREITMFSVFDDIWVNGNKLEDSKYVFAFVRENNTVHDKRTHLCFAPYLTYMGYSNQDTISKMLKTIGCKDSGCWFVSDITIENQEKVYFSIVIVNPEGSEEYKDTKERGEAWEDARNKQFARKRSNDQIIYFGTPGTGKSNKILTYLEETLKNELDDRSFRTTFHPDSDYASFVGCYKPTMKGHDIEYSYVAQVFTKAYIAAWNNPQYDYYLIIEEINRGNCAQIFGDIFQLLDRDDNGYSKFPIDADDDLKKYLVEHLTCFDGIKKGKLSLPCNLAIYATMNTSDQSLFPMDSAFKRRWSWEYIPINLTKDTESYKFTISLDNGLSYKWIDFLGAVNEKILDITKSEDKQLGNYFIKGNITKKEFVSKVLYYIWSEVCKKEYKTPKNFFRYGEGAKETEFSFGELFGKEQDAILEGFMQKLGLKGKEVTKSNENDSLEEESQKEVLEQEIQFTESENTSTEG